MARHGTATDWQGMTPMDCHGKAWFAPRLARPSATGQGPVRPYLARQQSISISRVREKFLVPDHVCTCTCTWIVITYVYRDGKWPRWIAKGLPWGLPATATHVARHALPVAMHRTCALPVRRCAVPCRGLPWIARRDMALIMILARTMRRFAYMVRPVAEVLQVQGQPRRGASLGHGGSLMGA